MNEQAFWDYFNVADELDGGLTLAELNPAVVARARQCPDLPWPPDLAAAEDYALRMREAARLDYVASTHTSVANKFQLTERGQECELCGEVVYGDEEAAEMYDPTYPQEQSVFCHAQCGLSRKMNVA